MPKLKRQFIEHCIYFITTNAKERKPVFKNHSFCDILVEALNYNRKKRQCLLLGYVIMPDHIHLLLFTKEGPDISKIMQSIKGYTSRVINQELKTKGNLWQANFYPRIIDNDEMFYQKLDYIHANPVKHGFAKFPDNWKYSSYRSLYLNDHSVIEVDRLEDCA